MSDGKDPAIKLFGKTIPLPDNNPNGVGETQFSDEVLSCERLNSQESLDANETASTDDNPKTPTTDNESPASKIPNTEEEQNETANSQDNKTLKKPDKILPCPRCNSMETKFCYYNNYNVTQPRYFCKKCQRYWTAGGTMRNVPIGAGRRKNKNSAPHYRHISVSEALQNAGVVAHYPTVRPNGTVMTFHNGSYEPVNLGILEKTVPDCARNGFQELVNLKSLEKTVQDCARNRFHEPVKLNILESARSGFHEPLNLKVPEKPFQGCARNEFHEPVNLKVPVPYGGVNNCDDQFRMSSITATDIKDESDNNKTGNVQMQNRHIPVFASPTWPYNTSQWVPPPGVYPMPFYPAPPYWGCAIQPPWTFPWVTMPLTTSPISPTLGKHSRDEDSTKQSEEGEGKRDSGSERSLWVPKTLRIDDPGEAAKSSIWATLGINHNKCELSSGGGKGSLFKAFNSRADKERDTYDNSPVLQANPAALSRSRNFQEHS